MPLKELIAVVITISILFGLPIVVFNEAPDLKKDSIPTIHLTGVMKDGVWTTGKVNGMTYWNRSFKPAHLVLEKGKKVRLQFSSSDVTHSFYIPELFHEPIIVKAGYIEEIIITPDTLGNFIYYCTSVCGECHYTMQGNVTIVERREDFDANLVFEEAQIQCVYHEEPVETLSIVSQGKKLYSSLGCFTCHGEGGKGGVWNHNYINDFVPSLNTLAEKMKLYWEDDVELIVGLLEKKVDLVSFDGNETIENYNRFIAQYRSITEKIKNGSPDIQKKELEGSMPPLNMPAWEHKLSNENIDAILAYLLTQYPWEEYD